jgi:hypothetical protein
MSEAPKQEEGIRLTPEEKARQAKRNRAIAFAVAGLCVLFYVITVVKMGPAIFNRTL